MNLNWLETDVPTLKLNKEDTEFFDEFVSESVSDCPLFKELMRKEPMWSNSDENDGL